MERKKEYITKDISGSFPATLLNAALVERNKKVQAELIMVVDRGGDKIEARYYGDTSGDYATYAVESLVKAGFKGSNWNDLRKGFNSETFDVVPFNATIQEVTPKEGDKLGTPFYQVKFINTPDKGGAKKYEGQVNGMEGSFMSAKAKLSKPAAQPSSNKAW